MEDKIKLQIKNNENFDSWELNAKQLIIKGENKNKYYLHADIQDKLNEIEYFFGKEKENKNLDLTYKLLPEETEKSSIFRAFDLTSIEKTKVLILGQDPYPGVDIIKKEPKYRADGLAFSFGNAAKADDSIKNIFEKLDIQEIENYTTNLTKWAENGVLLLNTSLTFGKIFKEKNQKLSEKEKNIQKKIQELHFTLWKEPIEKIIESLINYKTSKNEPLVIILWGEKANLFWNFKNDRNDKANNNILILRASHPSNLGKNYCGFYENATTKLKVKKLTKIVPAFICPCHNHFELCNLFLKENDVEEIDWKGLLKIYTEK